MSFQESEPNKVRCVLFDTFTSILHVPLHLLDHFKAYFVSCNEFQPAIPSVWVRLIKLWALISEVMSSTTKMQRIPLKLKYES